MNFKLNLWVYQKHHEAQKFEFTFKFVIFIFKSQIAYHLPRLQIHLKYIEQTNGDLEHVIQDGVHVA